MAVYLLVRPYGDAGDAGNSVSSAQAFASTGWVVVHLAGMGALASLARLALRMNDLVGSPLTRFARWTGLAGLGAVLPAYGAETIGLHVLGQRALDGDSAALVAAEAIRASAAFTGLLGVGLLLLAVSGACVAAAWRSWAATVETGVSGRCWHRWAAWPLSIAAASLLPQFFLPPAGRMAFGVVYALAAALGGGGCSRRGRRLRPPGCPRPAMRRAHSRTPRTRCAGPRRPWTRCAGPAPRW